MLPSRLAVPAALRGARLALAGRPPGLCRLLRPLAPEVAAPRGASSGAPTLRSVLVSAAAAAEPAAHAAGFAELGLGEGLTAGLTNNGITQPTEIQVRPAAGQRGRRTRAAGSSSGGGATRAKQRRRHARCCRRTSLCQQLSLECTL